MVGPTPLTGQWELRLDLMIVVTGKGEYINFIVIQREIVTYNTYGGIVSDSINTAHVCEMYSLTGEISSIQTQVSDMQESGKVAAWSSSESHLETTFHQLDQSENVQKRLYPLYVLAMRFLFQSSPHKYNSHGDIHNLLVSAMAPSNLCKISCTPKP